MTETPLDPQPKVEVQPPPFPPRHQDFNAPAPDATRATVVRWEQSQPSAIHALRKQLAESEASLRALRAENARLREALEEVASSWHGEDCGILHGSTCDDDCPMHIARAALTPDTPHDP